MVQEFHVIRCSTCESFQVQQVKKVNKWSCKLCGEKQSLLKEFGRGSGADCRRHVQKLNTSRGATMEEQDTWSLRKQVEADREDVPEEYDQMRPTGSSRWSKYLDTPEEAEPEEEGEEEGEGEEEEEENVLMDRQQLHGNDMTDRKRKRIKGQTDEGRPDKWTPEQTNWSSRMMKPGKTTSLRNKSPPSENHTRTKSLNYTSPPRKKSINPPSVSSGPVSRWACFLRSDFQVEGEEPSVSGGSQSVGGAVSLSCNDIISQARTILPVSSMFESGEDFSFDDF
ncbi:MRN complex-interacting protein [Cebidichthys violaceus]|uniref:MRN complex-interacting protein n=1 Tax=Cebidichthys violaceus TaxID=271503 RepID=UPI0035C9DE45